MATKPLAWTDLSPSQFESTVVVYDGSNWRHKLIRPIGGSRYGTTKTTSWQVSEPSRRARWGFVYRDSLSRRWAVEFRSRNMTRLPSADADSADDQFVRSTCEVSVSLG